MADNRAHGDIFTAGDDDDDELLLGGLSATSVSQSELSEFSDSGSLDAQPSVVSERNPRERGVHQPAVVTLKGREDDSALTDEASFDDSFEELSGAEDYTPSTIGGTLRSDAPAKRRHVRTSALKRQQLNDASEPLDPELYGLRRSSRVRPSSVSRRYLESEQDSGDEAGSTYRRHNDAYDHFLDGAVTSEDSMSLDDDDDDDDGDDDDYGAKRRQRTKRKTIRTANKVQRVKPAGSFDSGFNAVLEYGDGENGFNSSSDGEWSTSIKKAKLRRATHNASHRQLAATRASNRARSSAVNYGELDNQDWGISDDESYLAYDIQAVAAQPEYEGDVIESIHDYRVKEGIDVDAYEEIPTEYLDLLVKWKNWSHLHNTWDSYEDLRGFKGFKRAENFVRQVIASDHAIRIDPSTTREEIEQHDINREMERAAMEDYKSVERIIASRQVSVSATAQAARPGDTTRSVDPSADASGTTIEYLCKWKRLPYIQCTWEATELISGKFQAEIDTFLEREQSTQVPHRSVTFGRHHSRPSFKRMTAQPAYLTGGQLRDYQLTSLNWMSYLWSRGENGILADEMGLGKTVQTICWLSYLYNTAQVYGPFLVVVPLSTIGNWQREFARWAPEMNVIAYVGDSKSREMIREHEFYLPVTGQAQRRVKLNALLTTYELVLKDRRELGSIRWAFLAVDEAHRLKNSESQLHEALSEFHHTNRLLITGTPLQNSIKELYALINFLMPGRYSLSADFELDIDGASSEQQEAKIRELHELLRPLMLRRLKKDVEKSLPKKSERILRVELSPMQVHYYKNILTRNFEVLNRGVSGPGQLSMLNIAVELQKASNHPYLFEGAETMSQSREDQLRGLVMNSGKMVLLDKLLTRLRQGGHRVLIFSQMVRLLDIIQDYLALRSFPHQRLDGSVPNEMRKKAIDHFNAPGSPDFCFLLSTRAGGLGINLETADTVVIFDSDWNPQNDLQAMARAHRIGQTRTVNVYRFVSKGTIEEEVLERAKRKMVLEYLLVNGMDTSGAGLLKEKGAAPSGKNVKVYAGQFSKEELNAILKFGAKNMFQETATQKKLDDMDLDDILERAEQHDTAVVEAATAGGAQTSDGGAEFLAQFQVADYGGGGISWEDIVPKDERDRTDAEERAKEEAELWSPMRKRKAASSAVDSIREDLDNGTEIRKRSRGAGRRGTRSTINMDMSEQDDGEFSEREVRALVRAMMRFGHPRDRCSQVVQEADIGGKSRDLILVKADEVVTLCQSTALAQLGEVPDLLVALAGRRKSDKAIQCEMDNVTINAGQLSLRMADLKCLHKRLEGMPDPLHFRMPTSLRASVNWSVPWAPRDDASLLVGIHRHGFGAWDRIRDDQDLQLAQKIFVDERGPNGTRMSPGPMHLQRRADNLLRLLRELDHGKPGGSLANPVRGSTVHDKRRGGRSSARSHHSTRPLSVAVRSSRRTLAPGDESSSLSELSDAALEVSDSDAGDSYEEPIGGTIDEPALPGRRSANGSRRNGHSSGQSNSASRASRDTRLQMSVLESTTNPAPSGPSRDVDVSDDAYASMDEAECKELLRPVRRALRWLQTESDKCPTDEKVVRTKECVTDLGRHITQLLNQRFASATLDERTRRKRHLWKFASYFWPSEIPADRLLKLYQKMERLHALEEHKSGSGKPAVSKSSAASSVASPSPSTSRHRGQEHKVPDSGSVDKSRGSDRRERDRARESHRDHRRSSDRRHSRTRSEHSKSGGGHRPR